MASVMFLLIYFICTVSISDSKIELVNNGYEGVNVVITEAIEEDMELINRIKEELTDTSKLMFTATKNRAYFRNITIVVPKRWTTSHDYGKIPAVNSFTEHIRVDRKNKARGDAPYVRGNLECGKPGWFMHLTPDFLKTEGETSYGLHEQVMLKEWAQLHWGVFSEAPSLPHPNADKPNQMINFYNEDGSWKPVTCTMSVKGKAYRVHDDVIIPCGLNSLQLPASCRFCPYKDQPEVQGSFMGTPWIKSMAKFCEEDADTTPASVRHNSDAPNLQNKICNGQSVWEVLRKHEDFNGVNEAVNSSTDTTPTFHLVQATGRIRVFVFDVSGSMDSNKILKQRQAAMVAIDNLVEVGSWVGIVKFSSGATVIAPLTEIKDRKTRTDLKNKVPVTANGGTNIYRGLDTTIKEIETKFATQGTEIILLSDGASKPYLQITPELQQKGIIVHTIAITNAADEDMAQLSKDTGGISLFTSLDTESISLADVLGQTVTSGNIDAEGTEKVFSEMRTISSSSPFSGTFQIDDGLGRQSVVTVLLSVATRADINVTGPDDVLYHATGSSDILTLEISGVAEVGEYMFVVTTESVSNVTVTISVTSEPDSLEAEVIRVTSRLSNATVDMESSTEIKIYLNIEKGGNPVLNVNVTAVLGSDSSFNEVMIVLHDTGTGADVIANDGVYSAYLIKRYFTSNGRYNVKVDATGGSTAYIYAVDLDISLSLQTLYNLTSTEEFHAQLCSDIQDTPLKKLKLNYFYRQSLPGEITVINYEADKLDATPPARITDLTVKNIERGEHSITYKLSWTAVGDDMDIGQADSYEFRLDQNSRNLRNNFTTGELLVLEIASPKPSGEAEYVNITLTTEDCNGTCFIGLIAQDANGLRSETSNIVNADVDFSYDDAGTTKAYEHTSVAANEVVDEPRESLDIKIIIVISAGAFFVVVVIIVLAVRARVINIRKSGFDNIESGTASNDLAFSEVLSPQPVDTPGNVSPDQVNTQMTVVNVSASSCHNNPAYYDEVDEKDYFNDANHTETQRKYDYIESDPEPHSNTSIHHEYENLPKHNLFTKLSNT